MKYTSLLLMAAGLLLFVACKGPADKMSAGTDTALTAKAAGNTAAVDTNIVATKEYQITKPADWRKSERTMNNFEMLLLSAPKAADENFRSNINVLKDDMKGRDMSAYIDFNLQQMASMNVQHLKDEDLTVGGLKGKQLSYTYEYQGRNVAIKSYILPKNGTAYVLTATTLVNKADEYTPQFDKIVQSFKVL